jgi:hypothetical protein
MTSCNTPILLVQVPACWRQRHFFTADAGWEVVDDQQAWQAPIIGVRHAAAWQLDVVLPAAVLDSWKEISSFV